MVRLTDGTRIPAGQVGATAVQKKVRTLLVRNTVDLRGEPVCLPVPGAGGHAGEGELVLEEDNGVIKGFLFRCACGHVERFLLE